MYKSDNKTMEKESISSLLTLPALAGSLIGGAHGAYKAPKGMRPEGLGRGVYRGGAAGLGAGLGAGAGGLAGGLLGNVISEAISGPHGIGEDPRKLPLLVALLGAGLGGYGGGKLGWRMSKGVTGDNEALDREAEKEEKQSSDLFRVKVALEKQAFLPQALSAVGKGVGHLIGGGAKLWGKGVSKGLRTKGVVPKTLALGGGGLSLAALNELLSATEGGPIELPHFGMGSTQRWWDPMMHHERIDPKKTGFKSLFHMASRPLQTLAVATGMAERPSGLADYARPINTDGRLSEILSDIKNYRIDPTSGKALVEGSLPVEMDPTLMEQIRDFQSQKQRLEDLGVLRSSGGSSYTTAPGRGTASNPFNWRQGSRGRFD